MTFKRKMFLFLSDENVKADVNYHDKSSVRQLVRLALAQYQDRFFYFSIEI